MAKQSRQQQRGSSSGRSQGGQNWSQRNPSERSFGEERGRYGNTGDYRRPDYEGYSQPEQGYGQQGGYGRQPNWNPGYQTPGRGYGGYEGRDYRRENRSGERQGSERQGWTGQGFQGGPGYRGSEESFGGAQWRSSPGEYGRGDYGDDVSYGEQRAWGGASDSRSSSRSGQFTGRGPQGYKRSDERIQEDINEALTQHGDIDATMITVEVKNGEVTLRGTVSDRDAKRMAEDIAENASGVRDVQNQLRVRREEESASESRQDRSEEGKRKQSAA